MSLKDDLDNLELISTIDSFRMADALKYTPNYYEDAFKLTENFNVELFKNRDFLNVVFLGMGGSSIGGSLLKDWCYEDALLPIEVCRDSIVPGYLSSKTLVFAISYSGNTQETLHSFSLALKKGCTIIGLSSGGLLEEYCLRFNVKHVKVPSGFQPRLALPYLFIPPALILEKLELVRGFKNELMEALSILRSLGEDLKPSTPLNHNEAKILALNLKDKLPVIYGFRWLNSVAYRWKTQINENSKVFCKYDVLPELNHNEVVGWENIKPPLLNFLSIILLRDRDEPLEIKVRIEILKEILKEKTEKIFEVYGKGKSKLSKMLSTIYTGDYVSFYLAIINRVNPTPVKTINMLKRALEEKYKLTKRNGG
ncbi:MAG: bifunctional phosphoglucose/phosphomannose isomerase [Candidatus Bathyarchaeota archaeon]|nr:bifunctional phosphoglucose/phosphomannose isomerase [Candidatus Bathyarchaeota archaeon]